MSIVKIYQAATTVPRWTAKMNGVHTLFVGSIMSPLRHETQFTDAYRLVLTNVVRILSA
jgi:hypothetical protein